MSASKVVPLSLKIYDDHILFWGCCYITVDFKKAPTSQNGVYNILQMYHIKILFHNVVILKYESNKKCNVFCIFLNNIGFLTKGKLVSTKSFLWYSCCKIHIYVAAPFWDLWTMDKWKAKELHFVTGERDRFEV